ncbi:MAG: FdtA/QdtA family cupin domain-containing protein [Vicinamibacterales bacterium]|nr:FdtA/QdtA family cupin domain-containing protein [Vicinamibacterales bacterium]
MTDAPPPTSLHRPPTAVPGDLDAVRWIDLPSHADARGVLTAVEGGRDLPFAIARVYFVHDIVQERGGHAHRDTHQVVVAAHGQFTITLSDGTRERAFVVSDIRRGLYLGPMLFIRLHDFSPGAVMASLASTHYDTARSIRSWPDYLAAIGHPGP